MRLVFILAATLTLLSCTGGAREAAPCVAQAFEGDEFVVCTFTPSRQRLRLAWAAADGAPYRSFAALSADVPADTVAFAMNAGMFDTAGGPIGLYVEQRRELHAISTSDGPGNFHMKPNGVFWADDAGTTHIMSTDAYLAAKPDPVWATQSGPMLVIDGALHPDFSADGQSRYVRNGVGVTRDGATYFVISDSPVSFGKMARFFRDELKSNNALYFDGAVSSLWAPSLKRMDASSRLGPFIVVTSPSLSQP